MRHPRDSGKASATWKTHKRMLTGVILKRLEQPDETRTFELGRFDLVTLGGMTIGRATYLAGWGWSRHVGASVGATHGTVEQIGLVLSGHATAVMRDSTIHDLVAGSLFCIPAKPHDSWVVGDSLTSHCISWAPTCMHKWYAPHGNCDAAFGIP